ncbi:succinylglutamate desuccinylase/aspartoacylase family protein [Cetobacterium sp. 2A]|uniref:M14 family metallopeptidase n=1 Tax=unclassified Cetobacterium TaxID=2630983 RepID=UPI00163B82F8|nr:succinylglutamate desuccinylase/aspartoacylase family protein [Cetobacterium sp. 2A]MBC2855058.1 succinylglutamate desuccinylase/aspartoacylase family protein [Cetobacterium sp. 2A]
MTVSKFLLISSASLALSMVSFGKTEYTGDKFLGKNIITNLDVSDLEAGNIYEFYFQGVENSLGNPWYIPVTIIKGKESGDKFLINSGVHGNELNPILTSYKVKEKLTPENVKGTVTIVHGMNTSGLLNNTRGFKFSGGSETTSDLNRQMDSEKNTNSDQKYSTLIWKNLLSKNADRVIDLHTGGKGNQFPLFVYADFRNPIIKQMAMLTGADIIKDDEGEKGSVETSYVLTNIPAITFELGTSETQQKDIVARATTGVLNNLIYSNNLSNEKIKEYESVTRNIV